MVRVAFRALLAFTLILMMLARMSGGKMPPQAFVAFHYWFVVSVFVFAAFGIRSAVLAWQQPQNRRAYLFDVLLAAAWVPYWYGNLR
jgi:hypothetical protein